MRERVCSTCGWHGPRWGLMRWGKGFICVNEDLCFRRFKLLVMMHDAVDENRSRSQA